MIKYFKPRIRSRHPSHFILREKGLLPLFPFKSIIRLGSFTSTKEVFNDEPNIVEINTVDAIKNSADKLLMKSCFTENKVKTADWYICHNETNFTNMIEVKDTLIEQLPYPIIAKHRLGSKGTGNYKLDSLEELKIWLNKRLERLDEYIFEKFYNYVREYRLHITEDGYFYTCRKMLKSDTPDKDKWYRNDEHCVWIMEDNELFDKPTCWDKIVEQSVKALKATGLDFGAVDVKVQSAKNSKNEIRKEVDFIIIEINSAPSFGEVTKVKYLDVLPKLLLNKNIKNKENVITEKIIESTC